MNERWLAAFAEQFPRARNRFETILDEQDLSSLEPSAKPGFVVVSGCARSGTTALAEFLQRSRQSLALSEPEPNLAIEARLAFDGRELDVASALNRTVGKRFASAISHGVGYAEKNVTLLPFVSEAAEQFGARVILLVRDGKQVVSSLLSWHQDLFGNVYREAAESAPLSEAAKAAASTNPHIDTSDYARPRPRSGDPRSSEWRSYSRLEMCAWYWAETCRWIRHYKETIPTENLFVFDVGHATEGEIADLVEFIQIEDLTGEQLREVLSMRVNSTASRSGRPASLVVENWTEDDRACFDAIAGMEMGRFGYGDSVRWRPSSYGRWWNEQEGGLDWYRWMYNSRIAAHRDLETFASASDGIQRVLDVGCGRAIGYADFFANQTMLGIDISQKEISWCQENLNNPLHSYSCVELSDLAEDEEFEKFDLAFSQGTIDNVYDMDKFLREIVSVSRRWIYVTAYRGWFPDLLEHQYRWVPATTCFYNNISSLRVHELLEGLGCKHIEITALPTGNARIPFETRIVAEVPPR